MKVSKLATTLILSLGVIGAASANGGAKISTMSQDEYKWASLMAQCSVVYEKVSHIAVNPKDRPGFAERSVQLEQSLTDMMADPSEAEGMIKWNQSAMSDITREKLTDALAKCYKDLELPLKQLKKQQG